MASEMFKDLLRAAMQRDCSRAAAVLHMHTTFPATLAVVTARINENVKQTADEFIDRMDAIAKAYNPHADQINVRCPFCGSPYCIRAVAFRLKNVTQFL